MDGVTNLLDVAADRLSIWNTATSSHEDVREIFLNNSRIKGATRLSQQVGDETDVVLIYDQPSNDEVPALSDLLAYMEQERLGIGATVNKHYNITRHNTSLVQINEGDLHVRTSKPPSIRGRQEMVLQQGDTHLSRITRNKDVRQSTVNHSDTQLLSITKRSKHTRNSILHFHEGARTTIKHSSLHRKTNHIIEIFAPVFMQRLKAPRRDTHNIIELFAPVYLQRIKNVTKVHRTIFLFAPN
jgi:hypothetical protein